MSTKDGPSPGGNGGPRCGGERDSDWPALSLRALEPTNFKFKSEVTNATSARAAGPDEIDQSGFKQGSEMSGLSVADAIAATDLGAGTPYMTFYTALHNFVPVGWSASAGIKHWQMTFIATTMLVRQHTLLKVLWRTCGPLLT